jgi:hypothetical protein
MSRIQGLLSLIESANDFYLVAPGRNDRSVYIQVDDICELAMKSWLHANTLRRQNECIAALETLRLVSINRHRNAVREFFNGEITHHQLKTTLELNCRRNQARRNILNQTLRTYQAPKEWSANREDGRFKNFSNITKEIKDLKPITDSIGTVNLSNQELHAVLDNIEGRREKRNGFFHDHEQTELTITQQECLNALTDLYRLCELLFDGEFRAEVQKLEWVAYRVQVMLIRIRKRSESRGRVFSLYVAFLSRQAPINSNPTLGIFEYQLLHSDASAFEDNLRAMLDREIVASNEVVQSVEAMKRPPVARLDQRQQAEAAFNALTETWRECFGVEWMPPTT